MSKIYRLMEWPCRWLLALVFLYSGIPKLLGIDEFAGIINAYGLLPEALPVPAAFSIASLEIVAAAGLLLRKTSALVLTTGGQGCCLAGKLYPSLLVVLPGFCS